LNHPMSSPQMMRMFGLPVLAIGRSLLCALAVRNAASAAGHGLPRTPPDMAGLVSERSPQIAVLGEFLRTARYARQRRAQGWQRKYRKREDW
jgi:hypothetical protein